MTETTTTATKTCTVTRGSNGEKCGAPGVTSFIGRDDREYVECADHAAPWSAPAADAFRVGQRVQVCHIGIVKVGVVKAIRRSRCDVEVPIGSGRNRSSKVISRAIEDVSAV